MSDMSQILNANLIKYNWFRKAFNSNSCFEKVLPLLYFIHLLCIWPKGVLWQIKCMVNKNMPDHYLARNSDAVFGRSAKTQHETLDYYKKTQYKEVHSFIISGKFSLNWNACVQKKETWTMSHNKMLHHIHTNTSLPLFKCSFS